MINSYMEKFSKAAKAAGIEKLKFYFEEQVSRDVSFYEGELENLERAEGKQLFIEGEVDGYAGSVFVENFDESLLDTHIRCIKESAESCKAAFVPYELTGLSQTAAAEYRFEDLQDTLDKMRQAEQTARNSDTRIQSGVQLHMSEMYRKVLLADEKLNSATDLTLHGHANVYLVAKDADQVQPGGKGYHFHAGNMPDLSQMAKEASESAVSRLGAGSYTTGNYPVVLDSYVVGELLDAFMSAFFARNVHSRMSVLAGKVGQQIAGENISILEDPRLPGGFSGRSFDDEGVPTQAKAIIRDGVLNCFLHNRQSAAQEGSASGGNGFKLNFNELVATGYTNVYIPAGDKTREQLLKEMRNGLLITGVSGVFAGARPNSGDFSLISNGYRVEQGKITQAVTQITIAGNFFDMLKNVADVGNDENWKCTHVGCVRTPSLYVRSLAISGEEK